MGAHWPTIAVLQKELNAIYSFFVLQSSYGYFLSQENKSLAIQLLFSDFNEVAQ